MFIKDILTFKHCSRLGNDVEKTDDKTDYIQSCTDFQALFMNGVIGLKNVTTLLLLCKLR